MAGTRPVIGFGPFEVNVRTGELRRYGIKLKIQDKPFSLLTLLLEKAGELVSRDEIKGRLWTDTDTFVDFDQGLGQIVWKLRQTLGDTAEEPRFVQTIAKRGLRFVGPVRFASQETKRSLAVLPFVNLSGDPAQDYFADGLTEELITQLARLSPQRLGVIARTSVMTYKNTAKQVVQIAQELGVQYVLEGSVRRAGKQVRITTQLIRADDQTQIWAATFDHSLHDALAVQTAVARQVAAALSIELAPSMGRASAPPGRGDSYDWYLRGRFEWNKRHETALLQAITHFHRALEEDPASARAYVGLAESYAALGYYGDLDPRDALPKAKRNAARALEIDRLMPEAYSAMAFVILQSEWDWKQADRLHQRALELDPNSAPAHHWHGIDLTQAGYLERGQAALSQALELDPLSVAVKAHLGRALYFARENGRALTILQEAVQSQPEYLPGCYFLGLSLLADGQVREALASLRTALAAVPASPIALSAYALVSARIGDRSEARRVRSLLEELGTRKYVSPYFLAVAGLEQERPAVTLSRLQQAHDERFSWLMYLPRHPIFDSLRDNCGFKTLVEKVESTVKRD